MEQPVERSRAGEDGKNHSHCDALASGDEEKVGSGEGKQEPAFVAGERSQQGRYARAAEGALPPACRGSAR